MKTNSSTEYPRYTIKKFSRIGQKPIIVAEAWVDDRGMLLYKILIQDQDVEQVLLKAQQEGGLQMLIPFSSHENELAIHGLKKHFVPLTDKIHFVDAIQFNLKSGLVDID